MQQDYDKIISLVKYNISKSNDSYVQFSDPSYKPINFSDKNFKQIEEIQLNNKIAFIDGGSAEILKSSNFSLNLIRVCYSIFVDDKRTESKRYDFFAFVSSKEVDSEIFFDVEFIGDNEIIPDKNDLLISSLDKTIKQGTSRASISIISNLIRRFSELNLATKIMEKLNENDIIVLDGSLQCTYYHETKYMDRLYHNATSKKIVVCGFSKTTSLMTDKGNSINNALNNLKPKGRWIYHPVVEINNPGHKADISFVKLHDKSKYIFRFEIFNTQKDKRDMVISLLSDNSTDPVFLGYPYGLINADMHARISNQEKEMFLTIFSTKFGKEWEQIKNSISNLDAHSILDNIS